MTKTPGPELVSDPGVFVYQRAPGRRAQVSAKGTVLSMTSLRISAPEGTTLPLLPAGVSWQKQHVDDRVELRVAVLKKEDQEIPVSGIPNYLWIDGHQAIAVSSVLARNFEALKELLAGFDLNSELRDPATFGMRIFQAFTNN